MHGAGRSSRAEPRAPGGVRRPRAGGARGKLCKTLKLALIAVCGGLLVEAAEDSRSVPQDVPALAEPIFLTTCGRTVGALLISTACAQVGIAAFYHTGIVPSNLTDMVRAANFGSEQGGYSGVLVIMVTTSRLALETSAITADEEIGRCESLIETARALGIPVVVGTLWTEPRECAETCAVSDERDERLLLELSPLADLAVVVGYPCSSSAVVAFGSEQAATRWIYVRDVGELVEILLRSRSR